jgi:hypothetical protein
MTVIKDSQLGLLCLKYEYGEGDFRLESMAGICGEMIGDG